MYVVIDDVAMSREHARALDRGFLTVAQIAQLGNPRQPRRWFWRPTRADFATHAFLATEITTVMDSVRHETVPG